ncbi:phenylacetate--CoA ligase family protein [Staphylococcus haemolyticus]|uniref:phenylacetate--CoA ligase family protein n=1 Tax=Staphylococcus haemolyticus TaxID=1283 RepID=UPI000F865AED|nr:phenylacetate--CoA ligase family protein [Staphylococcus haemolyticus]MCH4351757.1 phenylacetate--CoA ligase family protein [Staphylococcus haemolyticus]MCH4483980.1 phenylacetate--CoA ligase family protein [Staphylococcus haemolyticus]MCI2934623.1 phenylacetate--CoA ligase family protein [Staphylococcus haemolyticus]RSZ28973.1 phenylacetate--CoA ligase family protein [Staphylococcus haemolyticus]WBL55047.1 phenylacetate--CoA ligase family protein [Staphylococcus haemolyticus]
MLQFIYDHSPIAIQNIMVSIQGKLFEKQRYTQEYYEELERLRNCNDPFKLQEERMKSFYTFIKNNSKYYKEKLSNYNDSIDLENLAKYPVLTKELVRLNVEDMITRDKNDLITLGTGGSTGKSLKVYSSSLDMSRKIAYLDYFKEKHGVIKGMRRVSVGGRKIIPPNQKQKVFWRYNEPLNQLMLSAYHAEGENLKYYVEKLNEFQPESLDGFPTVIHRIAKYITENNIVLTFNPIAIFPTAEALTSEMRSDIEKAFNCPVRNQYASSEGAPFITEDINGDFEIGSMSGYFELEKVEGKIYELIVTGFYTTSTPLFRYKIGDSVELYEELPENYTQSDIKIKRIIGRNNDFLQSSERGIITNVYLSTAIRELGNNVIDSQFVQNNLDLVEVNLVVSKGASKRKIEAILEKQLKARFGNKTQFNFNFVDSIERTKGGKKRFMINNLK